jgi:hypothetical protein
MGVLDDANTGVPFYLAGSLNPAITPVEAPKFAYWLNVLTGLWYQKQDNGPTTNWIEINFGGGGASESGYRIPAGDLVAADIGKLVMWDTVAKVFALSPGGLGTPASRSVALMADPNEATAGTFATGWFRLTANPAHGDQVFAGGLKHAPAIATFGGDVVIGPTVQDSMINLAATLTSYVPFALYERFVWNAAQNRIDVFCDGSSYVGDEGSGNLFNVEPFASPVPSLWFFSDNNGANPPWFIATGGVSATFGDRVTINTNSGSWMVECGPDWALVPGDIAATAENLRVALAAKNPIGTYDCGSGPTPTPMIMTRNPADTVVIANTTPGFDGGFFSVSTVSPGASGNVIVIATVNGTCPTAAGAQKSWLGKLLAIDGVEAIIDGQAVLTAIATEVFTSNVTLLAPINGTQVRSYIPGIDLFYARALNNGIAGEAVYMFRQI